MVSFNTREIEDLNQNLLMQTKKSEEPSESSKNEVSQQKSPTKSAIKKQPVQFDVKEPKRN
jgi:hypothetical protein